MDWLGSLRIIQKGDRRVCLGVGVASKVAGLLGFATGMVLWWHNLHTSALLWVPCLLLAAMGLFVFGLKRTLDFDGRSGWLRMEQGVFHITRTGRVPLFHLRAVIVRATDTGQGGGIRGYFRSNYVMYIERRVGEPIYVDEARRCAPLLKLAEAISDATGVRLEYDATQRMVQNR